MTSSISLEYFNQQCGKAAFKFFLPNTTQVSNIRKVKTEKTFSKLVSSISNSKTSLEEMLKNYTNCDPGTTMAGTAHTKSLANLQNP